MRNGERTYAMYWIVFPKFIYWHRNPHETVLDIGLLRRWLRWNKVIWMERWLNRTFTLIRKTPAFSFFHMRERVVVCKTGRDSSLEPKHASTLISKFQPIELWEIILCFLNNPVYYILYGIPISLIQHSSKDNASLEKS